MITNFHQCGILCKFDQHTVAQQEGDAKLMAATAIATARVSSHLWEAHDPIKGTLFLDNLFKEVLRAVPASVCDSVTLLILDKSNSSTPNKTCFCGGACAGWRCENTVLEAAKLADTVLPSPHSTTHSKDPQNRVSHLLVLGHLRHWGHLHTPMLEWEQDFIAKAAEVCSRVNSRTTYNIN